MTTTFAEIAGYPKVLMLSDKTLVTIRPLEPGDKLRLLRFFERVPEEERHYLKENVTAPEVIQDWTTNIDCKRVFPIVALFGDVIVADATLHRSRSEAHRHIGEISLVVDPSYRDIGLGRRLIRELLDIGHGLGLHAATMEWATLRETPAIMAARSVGFEEVATLPSRIRDYWGNYLDMVFLEIPLQDRRRWWSPGIP